MTLRRIAIALLIALTPAAAQISSAPGVCFAFNTTAAFPTSSLPLVAGGNLQFGFTAPVTATVEQIDIAVSYPVLPVVAVHVYPVTPAGLGPLITTGTSLAPTINSLLPLILSPPLPVAAGSSYALRLTQAQAFIFVTGDISQPTPIPYLLNCGATPQPFFPPCTAYATTGTYGPWLSFRSSTCGQTPYAVATQVGAGCGGAPLSSSPILYPTTPPVLGAPFTFSVAAYYGGPGTIYLFWAAGPATAGLNLGLGGGCTSYLDPISLQAFTAAGLEPLVSFPGLAITSATIGIPANPALAGVSVTTQAMAIGLTGVPTPFGNIQISNALQLTLGY